MNRLEQQPKFRHPNIIIEANKTIIPCASKNEIIPITLAPFPDHGRPAFVASTIKSRDIFIEAAKNLTLDESQRLNAAMERTIEELLDKGRIINSSAVLTSAAEYKPDIHVIIIGNPYKDNSLRLYCHMGKHEDAIVLFQDARTTKKDAEKVEKIFCKEAGYKFPKDWNSRGNRN